MGRFGTGDAPDLLGVGGERAALQSILWSGGCFRTVCFLRGWSLYSDLGYHSVRVGFGGFHNHSSFCPWPKSPSLSPRPSLYLLWRHLPPEPAHPCELSPCPPFQGKSNTALEAFRSSPKPTTTPHPSHPFGLCSPLSQEGACPAPAFPGGFPIPSPTVGTPRGCSPATGSQQPPHGECPAGRFTAKVPAQIFITIPFLF